MSKQLIENENAQAQELITEQTKYRIQTLSIKEDTNMTRIYSVVYKCDFFNHAKTKVNKL